MIDFFRRLFARGNRKPAHVPQTYRVGGTTAQVVRQRRPGAPRELRTHIEPTTRDTRDFVWTETAVPQRRSSVGHSPRRVTPVRTSRPTTDRYRASYSASDAATTAAVQAATTAAIAGSVAASSAASSAACSAGTSACF